MNGIYSLLIFLCLVTIIILMINIAVVNQKDDPFMKWVCIFLFAFSMMRYLTLIVYGDSPSLSQLEVLRYFYLATSIGLTIPFASALWYITPHLREKINYLKYLSFFVPWIFFYLFVIVTQPTQIVRGKNFGYVLELVGSFPRYLSIVQGSFVFIMFIICLTGLLYYKNSQLRSQYLVLIFSLIVLTLDGLSYFIPINSFLPPFTVSEMFGFLAILYAFSLKPLKLNKRQSS